MNKKIPKQDNSIADDLFDALIDDVNGISEDTVYDQEPETQGLKETVALDMLIPSFKEETALKPLSLNAEPIGKSDIPDYWDSVDKISDNKPEISFEDIPKEVGVLAPAVEKYDGPEASDNFLDQIQFNLSPPEHAGGIIKVNTGATHELFPEKIEHIEHNENFNPAVVESTVDLAATQAIKPFKLEKTEVVLPSEEEEVVDNPHIFEEFVETKQIPADADKTIAVTAFAQRQKHHLKNQNNETTNAGTEEKVFLNTRGSKVNTSHVSIDASLAQAESLRIAQNRILDLEKEIERLRQENDEILTASEIIKNKSEELTIKVSNLEKENQELKSEFKNENSILKGSLVFKDSENAKLQDKIDELELRVKNDFKKIRIRERELENRLELMRVEKQAVIKSKDELLLELQRKNDISKSELETYRNKVQELNKTIESYQNQIKITVRTLRLALSHVEDKGENQPIQYKKAT